MKSLREIMIIHPLIKSPVKSKILYKSLKAPIRMEMYGTRTLVPGKTTYQQSRNWNFSPKKISYTFNYYRLPKATDYLRGLKAPIRMEIYGVGTSGPEESSNHNLINSQTHRYQNIINISKVAKHILHP